MSEKIAFSKFKTPNELAESLNSGNTVLRESALRAMRGIRHIKNPISQWTGNYENLMKIKSRLFFIFDQRTLGSDHELFLSKIEANNSMLSRVIMRRKHVSRDSDSKELTREGINNLQEYYEEDIQLYRKLHKYKEINFHQS